MSVTIVTDVNVYRDTAMLTSRRVGNIVTDVNNHRDTAMLTCRRVGDIVTDVNNHRDTAMSVAGSVTLVTMTMTPISALLCIEKVHNIHR